MLYLLIIVDTDHKWLHFLCIVWKAWQSIHENQNYGCHRWCEPDGVSVRNNILDKSVSLYFPLSFPFCILMDSNIASVCIFPYLAIYLSYIPLSTHPFLLTYSANRWLYLMHWKNNDLCFSLMPEFLCNRYCILVIHRCRHFWGITPEHWASINQGSHDFVH